MLALEKRRTYHAESPENVQVNLVEVEVAAVDADIKVLLLSAGHSHHSVLVSLGQQLRTELT